MKCNLGQMQHADGQVEINVTNLRKALIRLNTKRKHFNIKDEIRTCLKGHRRYSMIVFTQMDILHVKYLIFLQIMD